MCKAEIQQPPPRKCLHLRGLRDWWGETDSNRRRAGPDRFTVGTASCTTPIKTRKCKFVFSNCAPSCALGCYTPVFTASFHVCQWSVSSPLKKPALTPGTASASVERVKNGLNKAVFNPVSPSLSCSRRQSGLFQRAVRDCPKTSCTSPGGVESANSRIFS